MAVPALPLHTYNVGSAYVLGYEPTTSPFSSYASGSPGQYVGGINVGNDRLAVYNNLPLGSPTFLNARDINMSAWGDLALGLYEWTFNDVLTYRRAIICPTITDPAIRSLVELWIMEGV